MLRQNICEFHFRFKNEDIIYLDSLWNDIYFELDNNTLYYTDYRSESEYF